MPETSVPFAEVSAGVGVILWMGVELGIGVMVGYCVLVTVGVFDGVGLKAATAVMVRAWAVRARFGVEVGGRGVGDGAGNSGLQAEVASTMVITIHWISVLPFVHMARSQGRQFATLISMDNWQKSMVPQYTPQVSV